MIHIAGLKTVWESVQKPPLYYDNNLVGAITLLQVMEAHGCKKLMGPREEPCTRFGNNHYFLVLHSRWEVR